MNLRERLPYLRQKSWSRAIRSALRVSPTLTQMGPFARAEYLRIVDRGYLHGLPKRLRTSAVLNAFMSDLQAIGPHRVFDHLMVLETSLPLAKVSHAELLALQAACRAYTLRWNDDDVSPRLWSLVAWRKAVEQIHRDGYTVTKDNPAARFNYSAKLNDEMYQLWITSGSLPDVRLCPSETLNEVLCDPLDRKVYFAACLWCHQRAQDTAYNDVLWSQRLQATQALSESEKELLSLLLPTLDGTWDDALATVVTLCEE